MYGKNFHIRGQRGSSLIELLVSTALALTAMTTVLSSGQFMRHQFSHNIKRFEAEDNLRGAMGIIADKIRSAGELGDSFFPAVELVQSQDGGSDEIVLRRSIMEGFVLCEGIVAGTNNHHFKVATDKTFGYLYDSDGDQIMVPATGGGQEPKTSAGCLNDAANLARMNQWKDHRLSSRTGRADTVRVFVYDRESEVGQFGNYTEEKQNNKFIQLRVNPDQPWLVNYQPGTSSISIIEESKITVENSELKLIADSNRREPQTIAVNVADMQMSITKKDGSVVDTFGAGSNWKLIAGIDVQLAMTGTAVGKSYTRSLSGRFFPRNGLSVD